VLPRLPFLWSYGVFRYSVPLRVVIVSRDITYVIIILYSWHLVICEHFWPYVWNNWSWVMHTKSTWFWHKNQVWHMCYWIFTQSRLFLPWHAYPMSEPSWCSCVYPWSSYYVRWWWDGFHHLSTCCQVCIGSFDHVPSCQVPEATVSWGSRVGSANLLLKAPGCALPEARALPQVGQEGGTSGQVAKSCPSVPIVGWSGEGAVCSHD
jgi:hypothetical protein